MKTGPAHPFFVFYCRPHNKSFTVYPPGFVPYRRELLVAVGPDGSSMKNEEGLSPFSGTLFNAALDASEGVIWPQEYLNNEVKKGVFVTQYRHLKISSLILGIHPDVDDKKREMLSAQIDVPCQSVVDNTNRLKNQFNCREIGKAICRILDQISQTPSLFENLALAGAMISLWPTPILCNEKGEKYSHSPFQTIGTRAPP